MSEPKLYEYQGQMMNIYQISQICGIKPNTIRTRIHRYINDGMSYEEAMDLATTEKVKPSPHNCNPTREWLAMSDEPRGFK